MNGVVFDHVKKYDYNGSGILWKSLKNRGCNMHLIETF
jgi:hypothetical protein